MGGRHSCTRNLSVSVPSGDIEELTRNNDHQALSIDINHPVMERQLSFKASLSMSPDRPRLVKQLSKSPQSSKLHASYEEMKSGYEKKITEPMSVSESKIDDALYEDHCHDTMKLPFEELIGWEVFIDDVGVGVIRSVDSTYRVVIVTIQLSDGRLHSHYLDTKGKSSNDKNPTVRVNNMKLLNKLM